MSPHRVATVAVASLAAAVLGCSAGAGTSSQASQAATTSASTLLVPYVPLAAETTYVAVDPALTSAPAIDGGTCSATTTPSSAVTDPTSRFATRTSALTSPTSGLGEFAVELVDAPAPVVNKLYVTIDSVSVHVAGQGWIPLESAPAGPIYVDLLTLKDSTSTTAADLGLTQLPAGTVTQIRLLLSTEIAKGNPTQWPQYVVPADENGADADPVELKVPSGYETGIKILGPWGVTACNRTTVTLDFSGEKSLWYHPNGHETEWILRPVIHPKRTRVEGIACSDTGTVSTDPVPVDGTTTPPTTEPTPVDTTTPPTTEPAPVDTTPTPVTVSTGTTTFTCTPNSVGTVATGSTPPGGACGAPAECTSGICLGGLCTLGGPGTTCTRSAECLSGTCSNGACTISTGGQSCSVGTDCASGVCVSGTCTSSGTGLPPGSACSVPAECASGACYDGTCLGAISGQTCTTTTDCSAGFKCVSTSYTATTICAFPMSQ